MVLDPNIATQTFYSCYVSYFWDYGMEGLPVAGSAGIPMEVVAEHAPICLKVVNFVAQSYDQNPQPPDPDPGANEVLKQKALSKPFLMEMGDGTLVYTVAGVYVYILLAPPSDTDSLNFAVAPYDTSVQNVLFPSDFIKGLLAGFTPTGQGPYGGVVGNLPGKGLFPGN